jgi:hypothetical protein
MWASKENHLQILLALLEYGADVNAQTEVRVSPYLSPRCVSVSLTLCLSLDLPILSFRMEPLR